MIIIQPAATFPPDVSTKMPSGICKFRVYLQWPYRGPFSRIALTAGRANIRALQASMFGQSLMWTPRNSNIHGIAKGKYERSASVGRSAKAIYFCSGHESLLSRISHWVRQFECNLYTQLITKDVELQIRQQIVAHNGEEKSRAYVLRNCPGKWFWILPIGISFEEIKPVLYRRAESELISLHHLVAINAITYPNPAVWYAVQDNTAALSHAVRPLHKPPTSNLSARYWMQAVPSNTIISFPESGSWSFNAGT